MSAAAERKRQRQGAFNAWLDGDDIVIGGLPELREQPVIIDRLIHLLASRLKLKNEFFRRQQHESQRGDYVSLRKLKAVLIRDTTTDRVLEREEALAKVKQILADPCCARELCSTARAHHSKPIRGGKRNR
jgi:hypothetical protein